MLIPLLLFLSICFAASNNLLLHKFSNRGLETRGDILLFNAMTSAVWIVVISLLAAFGGGFEFTGASIFWGICYGVVIALFLLCKMQAMAKGPVSLTAFIGCSSLLVSTAFGVFVLREGMSAKQGIGVVLLLIGLFLVASPKVEQAQRGCKLWCAAFLVCGAATGIIFKLASKERLCRAD